MNFNRLTILSVLALLGTSCVREFAETDGAQNGREIEIGVCLPDAATRTVLGAETDGKYPTIWSEGDVISLNGIKSVPLKADGAGSNVASFKFKGDITYPYNILYPGTEEHDKVSFLAVQQYVSGSFDPLAVPMYNASRSFENVTLSHLSSLLKFSLTSSESVKLAQIQVTSMGGEKISGTYRMEVDADGLFTGSMTAEDGSVSTSMTFGNEGHQLSSTPSEFYISIPHGSYSAGFTALVITTDRKVMTLKFYTKEQSEVTIVPAKVIEFETVEFASEGSTLLIESINDLISLNGYEGDADQAVIVSDLDLTDVEWTPIENLALDLNGSGHILKGLSAPLCKNLSSTVKDLTIEADIELTDGLRTAAFADVVTEEGVIENCVSKGNIVVANTSAADKVSVAGLAVEVRTGGCVTACSNRASISVSSKTSATAVSVGGCVAICTGTLHDVTNYGELDVDKISLTSYMYMGGVVAEAAPGELKNVKNAGKVSCKAASTVGNGVRVGGVVGKSKYTALDDTMISNTPESSVIYTVGAGAANPAIGGLVGMNEVANTTYTSLVNNSLVKVDFAGATATNDIKIGGITGYFYSPTASTKLTAVKCVNNGQIEITGAMKSGEKMHQGTQIGGIFGRVQITGSGTLFTLSECVNNGDILMNDTNGSAFAFIGGNLGTISVYESALSGNVNNGNIRRSGNSTAAVFMGGIIGNVYRDAESSSMISDCVNRAKIELYDAGTKLETAAGGIVGNASGIKGKALTLTVKDCLNEGEIYRENSSYSRDCNSYAGGIIGAVGRRHQTTTEGYATVTVQDCRNTAQIIYNQFAGFETFNESSTDISFTGGIVGMSIADNGRTQIICCENSGNVLATSGQHGGILGFAHAGTTVKGIRNADGTVRYTVNTGNVCEHNPSAVTLPGSGFCIAGGIVGYLKSQTTESKKNFIEYCYNSGNVSGSVNTGTAPCAGGIVGKYQLSGTLKYCKNSGSIRNYTKGSHPLQYCGSISGSEYSVTVEYCGVGGKVHRNSGWIVIDEAGTYPFQNYIYRFNTLLNEDGTESSVYPADSYYKGCCYWDGSSQLPWEKSDWVEPVE